MSLLTISCASENLPNAYYACNPGKRKGSIDRLIIAKKNVEFDPNVNPFTDWESWKAFADNRDIMISPRLVSAEKPDTETTDELIIGCGTPEVIDEVHTITGQSKLFDNVDDQDFDFWAGIKDNQADYIFGWVDCNGRVYFDWLNNKPGFEMQGSGVKHIIPAERTASQYYMFTFTWSYLGLVKGHKIVNFDQAFKNAPVS